MGIRIEKGRKVGRWEAHPTSEYDTNELFYFFKKHTSCERANKIQLESACCPAGFHAGRNVDEQKRIKGRGWQKQGEGKMERESRRRKKQREKNLNIIQRVYEASNSIRHPTKEIPSLPRVRWVPFYDLFRLLFSVF